ncbi:prolipoprotein diacylglyceryl transferase family protein [Pistricoccus aurantiacus]
MTMLEQSVALGPVAISLGRLLILAAFLVALLVGALLGRRQRTSIGDTLFATLLVAIIGARLAFLARYWDSYTGPFEMLDIRDGGFDILGGLIAGLAYAAWRFYRVPAQRRALIGALVSGLLIWGVTAGSLMIMVDQSRPLPAIALETLDGRGTDLVTLHESTGEPMVVNLWATWCPPCRREMPLLGKAQRREDAVTFVFVNQGESSSRVRVYLNEESLGLDNVLLDPPLALGERVGAMGMPTTLFYDARGQLVDTHFGELSRATLARGLEQLR